MSGNFKTMQTWLCLLPLTKRLFSAYIEEMRVLDGQQSRKNFFVNNFISRSNIEYLPRLCTWPTELSIFQCFNAHVRSNHALSWKFTDRNFPRVLWVSKYRTFFYFIYQKFPNLSVHGPHLKIAVINCCKIKRYISCKYFYLFKKS